MKPKKPTKKEIKAAYRVLALDYVYGISQGRRLPWAERVEEAFEYLRDDLDVSNYLYEGLEESLEIEAKLWQ